MHHIILIAIAVLLTSGWIALPSRRTRVRFVAILAAVFIAGFVAGGGPKGLLMLLAYQNQQAALTQPQPRL